MSKIAIIINSEKDYFEQKKLFDKSTFISSNYYTYLKLKKFNISYLFKNINFSTKKFYEINHLSQYWYRDKNNIDLLERNNISIAIPMTRRILTIFSNNIKTLMAIEELLRHYDYIYISDLSEKNFQNVSKILHHKIKFFKGKNKVNNSFTALPDRTVIVPPKVYLISFFIRKFQNFIKLYLKHKILISHNWHYKKLFKNKPGTLYMNNLFLWNGYFFNSNKQEKFSLEAKEIFEKDVIKNFLISNRLSRNESIKKFNYSNNTIKLLENSISDVYDESYKNLRKIYISYRELYSFYRPKKIIFSGTTAAEYVLASQMARNYHIETLIAVDGHSVTTDPTAFYKDSSHKKFIFDKFIAYGSASYDLYHEQEKIPKENLILAQSPLYKNFVKNNKRRKKYIVILAYYPNLHNPFSRWDKRFSFVEEIITVLRDLNFTNIIVKVKDGFGSEKEISAYRDYLKLKNVNEGVIFKKGELSKFLSNTKMIIGQLSTAVYEASIQDIPFYIYEPHESGFIGEYFENSLFADYTNMARTMSDLKKLIANSSSLEYKSKDYTSDGLRLDKINL